MVRIRLQRRGRKKRAFYRLVVTDKRCRRGGEPIEDLGFYDPVQKQVKINKDSALAWIAKGAQPTETALRVINKVDVSCQLIQLETAKKEKLSKKAKAKAEAEAQAAEDAKKQAAEAKAAAKAEAEAAEKAAQEAPPAAEEAAAPAEEAPAEDAPAAE